MSSLQVGGVQPRGFDGRSLRVGLLAPPWLPVPPTEYGGTELVVDQLARGLTRLGCEVVLFATGTSTCPVTRRWCLPEPGEVVNDSLVELRQVQEGYCSLSDVDVIHDHTLLGPLWSTTAGNVPGGPLRVATLHGLLDPVQRRLAAAVADQVSLVAISRSQRRSAPEVPMAAVIHHGIEVDRFPAGSGDGGYVLFLGRMNEDKGAHRAIRAARAAGRRLLIAAKKREEPERRYFAREVEPLLGDDAVYLGEVGGRQKLELLAGAEALLNPIRWCEPFGLTMIEALACGTPVLTFDEGAAPEIVRHGVTGFLCADEADMAERLAELPGLQRDDCRSDVCRRFSVDRMAADHLALYRRLLEQHAAPADGARVVMSSSARRHQEHQEVTT